MKQYCFIFTTLRAKGAWFLPALHVEKCKDNTYISLKFLKKEIILTFFKDK